MYLSLSGRTNATITAKDVIGTLPDEYKPSTDKYSAISEVDNSGNVAMTLIWIDTSGNVYFTANVVLGMYVSGVLVYDI